MYHVTVPGRNKGTSGRKESTCRDLRSSGMLRGFDYSQLPTFRANLSVPYSKVKQSQKIILKDGPDNLSATSVTNYQSVLRNIPEERKSRIHRSGSLKSRMQIHITMPWGRNITYMLLLCLGGRNIQVVTVRGRKKFTSCYRVWEEGMYLLLCLGGRNVHVVTMSRGKKRNC